MSSAGSRLYYGWYVLFVAAAAMVGTLPGRTQGLGLITEPLLADLRLDRVTYADVNVVATLAGAVFALGIGRFIDRLGSRLVLAVVAAALGLVVCAMSQVTTLAGLVACLTLTRGLGQSALSVVSLAMVGKWFVRRIDFAMALYTITMSVGFMVAFPAVGAAIQSIGWRRAWLAIGLGLLVALVPLAILVVRRSPEACGLHVDGDVAVRAAAETPADATLTGVDWMVALASPAFWAFALGASLYGLIASGIGLFNQAILAERGFGPDIFYRTLVVTALTALLGNFFGGWLSQRVPLARLLAASMALLALGLVALPHVASPSHVMLWATTMGLGGGFITVLFFTVWPRLYGRRALGRIQGVAQALTVVASAIGPVLLARWVERTGSYSSAFYLLAVPVACVGVWALFLRSSVHDQAAAAV